MSHVSTAGVKQQEAICGSSALHMPVDMETSQRTRGIIIALHNEGYGVSDIARRVGVHRNTVSRWIKRHLETGATDDRPRSGRPHTTTLTNDQIGTQEQLHIKQENGMVSAAEDSDEEDLEKPSITHEEIDPTPAIGDVDLEQPSIKEEEIDPTPDIGDTKEGASVAIALDVVVPPKTAITDGGRDLDDAQEDVLATSMTEGADRVVPAGEHEDEFHHFGMYVASQLRGMPPRAAVEAQLEIQRALTMKRLQYLQ